MSDLNALTIRDDGDDWFVVEDDFFRRPQWASIEGNAADMIAMANALENGSRFVSANSRCAVYPREDGGAEITSPRNSMSPTTLTAAQARTLAVNIRKVLAKEETSR